MKKWKWMVLLVVVAGVALCGGCSSDDDDGGDAEGTYAGTYMGRIGGRDLVLVLKQDGNRVWGNYTLNNPAFAENLPNGTVTSLTPPSTAIITANATRHFGITFRNYNSFDGVFINNGKPVNTFGNK